MANSATTFTSPIGRVGFASKAVLIGFFLGAGVILRTGGSTITYVGAAILAGIVAAAIYGGLIALAAGFEEPRHPDEPTASRRHGRPVAADGRGDER